MDEEQYSRYLSQQEAREQLAEISQEREWEQQERALSAMEMSKRNNTDFLKQFIKTLKNK